MNSTKSSGVSRRLLIGAASASPLAGAPPSVAPRSSAGDSLLEICQVWLALHARQNEIHRTYGTVEERIRAQCRSGKKAGADLHTCADERLLLSMQEELQNWPGTSGRLLRRIRRMRAQHLDGILGKLQIGADGMDAEYCVYEHRVLVSAIADLKRLFSL